MCFIQRKNKLQGCYNALMLTKCLVFTFLFVCFVFVFQTIHTRKWPIFCPDRLKLISMERDISLLINNYRSIFFLSIPA